MKTFVKETTWLRAINTGWGNGYVCIPQGHPLHGVDYDEIHNLMPNLEVHGGLTFSQSAKEIDWPELPDGCENDWVVGFDTAHAWDTPLTWPKEAVELHTKILADQIESLQGRIEL